jgi:oligosaccharide 4-alpha-D-glucosyltransferase
LYEGIEQTQDAVNIRLNGASIRFTALNQSTMEVFFHPDGVKQLPSFAIAEEILAADKTNIKVSEQADQLTLDAGKLSAVITKVPFSIAYYKDGEFLVAENTGAFAYETMRGVNFTLQDDEKIMGAGQRVLGMDRRGHRLPLYNKAHYGYETESSQMYYSLPAVMSNKMYVIGFDNSASGYLDIGHTQKDVLQFEAVAGRTSYIISTGDTYADLTKNFVEVTGKQPLPPRWALGNYASRFGYKTQQQVMDTVELFKQQDFPLDAIVLDLYWFGPDIKGHMGNLEWDLENWPEPEKMIKDLKDQGVKTVMITEPFILTTSKQWDSAKSNAVLAKNLQGQPRTFDFYFGNTGLVDVFDPVAQDWFWQFYERLNQQGVSGWWGDLGEPEVHPSDSIHRLESGWATADEVHNAYGHKWAEMVYKKQKLSRPDERPFVMMRAGFLGSQRYGMIPWTGDVSRSWGGLKPQVELALQMSLFGLAYTHSDLGGFAGGETFDAELYTRWMQYGVFQPVYRPHAQDNIAPEPVFHDKATQDIVREYVKLRYRLLPYNYSLAYENSLTGLPMMRPTFMHTDKADIDGSLSYMWGDAFLVTPVVEQGQTTQQIDLPAGVWFDFWTSQKYQGGETISVDAPLETLPVLAKAGGFIPMLQNDIPHTDGYNTRELEVHYFADKSVASSRYVMFDDDGVDPNTIESGQYQKLVFEAQHQAQLNISLSLEGWFDSAPNNREVEFIIHGQTSFPSEVKLDGKVVEVSNKPKKPEVYAAWYNSEAKQLVVKGVLGSKLTVDVL